MIDFEAVGKAAVIAAYGYIPEAPKGYEFTGEFKKLSGSVDELLWLTNSGHIAASKYASTDGPRLILRRKMQRRLVGWTVRLIDKCSPEAFTFRKERWDGSSFPEIFFTPAESTCWSDDKKHYCNAIPIYEEIPEPTE